MSYQEPDENGLPPLRPDELEEIERLRHHRPMSVRDGVNAWVKEKLKPPSEAQIEFIVASPYLDGKRLTREEWSQWTWCDTKQHTFQATYRPPTTATEKICWQVFLRWFRTTPYDVIGPAYGLVCVASPSSPIMRGEEIHVQWSNAMYRHLSALAVHPAWDSSPERMVKAIQYAVSVRIGQPESVPPDMVGPYDAIQAEVHHSCKIDVPPATRGTTPWTSLRGVCVQDIINVINGMDHLRVHGLPAYSTCRDQLLIYLESIRECVHNGEPDFPPLDFTRLTTRVHRRLLTSLFELPHEPDVEADWAANVPQRPVEAGADEQGRALMFSDACFGAHLSVAPHLDGLAIRCERENNSDDLEPIVGPAGGRDFAADNEAFEAAGEHGHDEDGEVVDPGKEQNLEQVIEPAAEQAEQGQGEVSEEGSELTGLDLDEHQRPPKGQRPSVVIPPVIPPVIPAKRGRGRPPGVKDGMGQKPRPASGPPKKRGRPPGAVSEKKRAALAALSERR